MKDGDKLIELIKSKQEAELQLNIHTHLRMLQAMRDRLVWFTLTFSPLVSLEEYEECPSPRRTIVIPVVLPDNPSPGGGEGWGEAVLKLRRN